MSYNLHQSCWMTTSWIQTRACGKSGQIYNHSVFSVLNGFAPATSESGVWHSNPLTAAQYLGFTPNS